MYVISVLKAFWHLSNFCPCEQKTNERKKTKQNRPFSNVQFRTHCSNMQRASSVFERFSITFHDHSQSWIINKNFSQNQRIIFMFHKYLLLWTMTLHKCAAVVVWFMSLIHLQVALCLPDMKLAVTINAYKTQKPSTRRSQAQWAHCH